MVPLLEEALGEADYSSMRQATGEVVPATEEVVPATEEVVRPLWLGGSI